MLTQIKHYRILREIGGGGFAKVYLAQDENLKREVAIKLLHANLAEDSDFRRFFEREARLVASLEHLAVVPIYDYGEINGQLYLVMRYMRGGTLSDRLEKTRAAMTLPEVVKLLERLAPTLDAIHEKGVIHRDLKPSNILYDDSGNAYIADFGIARVQQGTSRLTQTGISFGTPQYSSPEQVTGETALDHRSDIYTLGVIVYELLTGEYPYWSDTPLGWVYKHLEAPVPKVREINRRVPEGVQGVLEGMMAKARTDRYDSVAAVLEDLKRAEAGRPIVFQVKKSRIPGTVPLNRPGRPVAEESVAAPNRMPLAIAAIAIVLVVGLLGWLVLNNSDGEDNNTAAAPTATVASEEVAVVPPEATASATTAVSTDANPPAEATAEATVAFATSTSLVVEPAAETPTATATVTETSTPEPSATATTAPALPTATATTLVLQIATRTPTVAPTRDLPIAAPPTAAATQVILVMPISLQEPWDNASFAPNDTITFRWEGGGTLQAGQYYDVRVWREGQPHYGVIASQYTWADLNASALGTGTFFWSVAVVSDRGATTVVNEAPPRQFTISGGGDGGYQIPAEPQPNPTVTAPPY